MTSAFLVLQFCAVLKFFWYHNFSVAVELHSITQRSLILNTTSLEQPQLHLRAATKIRTSVNCKLAKQDQQHTYNVILCSVRVTIVAVGVKQCVLCVLLSYMLLSTVTKY